MGAQALQIMRDMSPTMATLGVNNWPTDGIQGMLDATQGTIMAQTAPQDCEVAGAIQNSIDAPLTEDL